MENVNNIQTLFDKLKIEQVDAYMLDHNWKIVETNFSHLRVFERELDGKTQRVQLLHSHSDPQFRSKLQNFIFALAVSRSEEPVVIANEIYNIKLSTGPKTNDPSRNNDGLNIQSLSFSNCTSGSIDISCDGIWARSLCIDPDEKLAIISNLDDCSKPEIKIFDREIKITSTPSGSAKLFQIANPENQLTFSEITNYCCEKMSLDANQSEKIQSSVSRAEFELSDTEINSENQPAVLKTMAILLTSVARHLEGNDEHYHRLWKMTYDILGRFGGCVEIFPGAKQSLFSIAQQDEENAPSATLSWLTAHARHWPA